MHLGLTKSRDDKLLQDLLDKKLRVIVIFEDDYLNHIARIAYKDIQQDNYTYRIGEYNIYKGEEWGFYDFCKRHDCYFIVPNETIEGVSSEIPKDLLDAQVEIVEKLIGENNNDGENTAHPFACEYVVELLQKAVSAGAQWQYQKDRGKFAQIKSKTWSEGFDACKEQMMKDAKDGWMDEEDVIVLNDGTCIDLQPDYEKKPAFEFEYAQDVRVIILPKEDSHDTRRKE